MELSRFDLVIIKRALELVLRVEHDAHSKEILQRAVSEIADILTEYSRANVFLVNLDMLEE